MDNEEKEFEIVQGDGSNINMSPVSNYIASIKPKKNKTKKIIVPKSKQDNTKK